MMNDEKRFDHMNNKGSALLIAIILSVIAMILAAVGTRLITTSFRESKYQENFTAEAQNAASAGIEDAIGWFKKQQPQPVCSGLLPGTTKYDYPDGAFNPREVVVNPKDDSVSSDTMDENIGLVKEYQLSENGLKWARYEVKRQTNTVNAQYDPFAVHDITEYRIHSGEKNGQGLVWYIPSTGYIFTKRDSTKPFNVAPNAVIAKAKVSTEIKRFTINLPGNFAVIMNKSTTREWKEASNYWWWRENVQVRRSGRVCATGDNNGAFGRASGVFEPVITGTATVTNPLMLSVTNLPQPTVEYVFGCSASELKQIANLVSPNVDGLPNLSSGDPLGIIYIDGDAHFTIQKPLRGGGILFVKGNLIVDVDSASTFNGVIYVTGNTFLREPLIFNGSIISYNGIIVGEGTDYIGIAEVRYDQTVLNIVKQTLSRYIKTKPTSQVFTGLVDR